MKWFVYNCLFGVAYAAMLPSFLLRMWRRGGYRARMGDRFGRYPAELAAVLQPGPRVPRPVWIHAVSVGEVQVAGQLMRAMRAVDPALRFVFSTTSSTGWKTAETEMARNRRECPAAAADALIYNPLDFNGCVRRALDAVDPVAIILTETEIWPNFIRAAQKRGVPVFLVNARMSDRSAPRYRALRGFFGEVLRAITRIYAQSELDAERLRAAGADGKCIAVTGSFKFDVAARNPAKERELADWIRAGEAESRRDGLLPGFGEAPPPLPPVLLGGSTWPGEDEVLLRIYREVLRRHPDVRLVIAPRHFEKADAVERNILAAGFPCLRRSRGGRTPALDARSMEPTVYLCDTTGEMMGLFGLARAAFVGKSLCAHGSQNMIEPCLCGVPAFTGPYVENFRPVMSDLLSMNAIVQVADEDELSRGIQRVFDDPVWAAEQGARAARAVERRRGATAACATELVGFVRAAAADCRPRLPARRRRWWTVLALVACYALSWTFAPALLEKGWRRLRLDPNRTYGRFLALSAGTACYPSVLGSARAAWRDFSCREAPGLDEWGVDRYRAARLLGDLIPLFQGGTNAARRVDARLMTMARLKGVFEEYAAEHGGRFRLWCTGRYDYLLTPADALYAEDVLDLFADVKSFERFANAGVYTPAQVFGCYVAESEGLVEAFASIPAHGRWRGALSAPRLAFKPEPEGAAAPVRADRLVPVALPSMPWLLRGGVEAAAFASLTNRIAAAQAARREALLGFAAADAGSSTNALAHWAAAARINACDPLLRGLGDSLDLEGRRRLKIGDLNGAVRCYENRLEISPNDVAAVHNFGVCLKNAGHPEIAARVFLRAVQMDPFNDAHRLAFVESAAAGGHEDAACRQLDVLMKRHPEDPALKLRAAKLLCNEKNKARDDARAVQLAEEAATMTRWRRRAYVEGLADVYLSAGRVLMGVGLKKKMKAMTFDD